MQTTRWTDAKTKNLEDAITLLVATPPDDEPEESSGCVNWHVDKLFGENQVITLNGREITYNQVKYSYDQITAGEQPIEDRTVKKDGFIVAYFSGINVNYIISRNSDAQRILRKLLGYSGKNEITPNSFGIDSGLFIWLINKVYSGENTIEPDSEVLHNITIDAIKGFKGDTEDLLTKVSADGESVMNIISTLSFLLESKNLNQIKIDIQYEKHQSIELVLSNKQTISSAVENYIGALDALENKESILTQLLLIIYIEILPIIVQAYRNDFVNELWSDEKNIDFLTRVADDLSEKVRVKVEALRKTV